MGLLPEIELFSIILIVIYILSALGFAILIFFICKDMFINVFNYFILKIATSFEYHNDFTMDGRLCQLFKMGFTSSIIVDVKTNEIRVMSNRMFAKKCQEIWHKPPGKK